MKPPHRALTPERRARFLAELRKHGIFREAARVASPGADERWCAEKTFRDQMRREPEFAREVEEAIADANAALEVEAHRRAFEGFDEVSEEVKGDGSIRRTTRRRFSDAVLLKLLASRLPAWRHRVEVDKRSVRLSLVSGMDPGRLRSFAAEVWDLLPEEERHDVLDALGLDRALAAAPAFPRGAGPLALPAGDAAGEGSAGA